MNSITNVSQDMPDNCSFSTVSINSEVVSNLIHRNFTSKVLSDSIKEQSSDAKNTNIVKFVKLHLAKNEKSTYRKSYIAWDDIERANKPKSYTDKTKHLGKNSKALLSVIVQKLSKKDRVLLNHKYISTITRCERRQNQNIIKELSYILNINYHNSFTDTDNGKKYRYCYEFSLKELEQVDTSISADSNNSIEQKISRYTIYKENKFINNRSNKSNFIKISSYSFSRKENSCTAPDNIIKEVSCKKLGNETNTIIAEPDATYTLAATNTPASKKQAPQKTQPLASPHNSTGFLGSGKFLSEMLEHLTEDMCQLIRSKCGREFTDRAIREIAKAVSRSKKGSKAFFYHVKGFIAYLSKILRFEKRDPEKISDDNYYITSNQTKEEQDIQKQEKYLSEIEYSLQASSEWHLKKKLAAVLERSKAYKILTSFKSLDIRERKALIALNRHVELSDNDKEIILSQIQATHEKTEKEGTYQYIDFLEVEMPDKSISESISTSSLTFEQKLDFLKREGLWGRIRETFAKSFTSGGDNLDKAWLSKFKAKIDKEQKTIELHTSSRFVKDWVESNYLRYIEDAARKNGLFLQNLQYKI